MRKFAVMLVMVAAGFTAGAVAGPDFSRYEVILMRKPFGVLESRARDEARLEGVRQVLMPCARLTMARYTSTTGMETW